jgi:hypothetical protein
MNRWLAAGIIAAIGVITAVVLYIKKINPLDYIKDEVVQTV